MSFPTFPVSLRSCLFSPTLHVGVVRCFVLVFFSSSFSSSSSSSSSSSRRLRLQRSYKGKAQTCFLLVAATGPPGPSDGPMIFSMVLLLKLNRNYTVQHSRRCATVQQRVWRFCLKQTTHNVSTSGGDGTARTFSRSDDFRSGFYHCIAKEAIHVNTPEILQR